MSKQYKMSLIFDVGIVAATSEEALDLFREEIERQCGLFLQSRGDCRFLLKWETHQTFPKKWRVGQTVEYIRSQEGGGGMGFRKGWQAKIVAMPGLKKGEKRPPAQEYQIFWTTPIRADGSLGEARYWTTPGDVTLVEVPA